MGKDTMWNNRQFGWLLSALGAFPVTRGTADREALARCIAVLDGGEPLVLFPEGERKSGPVVQPLFDGAVYVAIKAGVPIVPVGIGGSEKVMPKKAKFVYPRKVHVEIGPPIPPPMRRRRRTPAAARSTRSTQQTLHAELQRLFDEAMSHVPWDYADRATELSRSTRSTRRSRRAVGDELAARPRPGRRSMRRSMRATASRPAASPNR